MLVVGLTGGIGSGKSAAADMFAELGVPIVDTDQIARELTQSGQPALADIRRQFGDAFFLPDGNLDRARLRRLIFQDRAAKRKLEAILHPPIKQEVRKRLGELTAPYAIVAVPLLLEGSGYRDVVQRILAMDCTEEQQIDRAAARSKLSRDEVRAIMANQVERADRLGRVDDICANQGDLEDLRRQVMHLHEKYLQLAA